jgi:hypothetical protein
MLVNDQPNGKYYSFCVRDDAYLYTHPNPLILATLTEACLTNIAEKEVDQNPCPPGSSQGDGQESGRMHNFRK